MSRTIQIRGKDVATEEQPCARACYHEMVFHDAGMAMVAADLQGTITAWNPAADHIFGASAREMIGTDWSQLIPLDERETSARFLFECLEYGKASEFEFALVNSYRQKRYLAALVTPIFKTQEQQIGGLACVRDITNRTILQQRLAQKSKMAALGEMAGALSHHFNNILGGVVTSVDFALASGEPLIQQRVMEKTAAALTRATGLVESLLAFAQGDFRDATLAELGEVLIEVIEQIESKLRGTHIGLEVDLKLIPVVEVPRSALHTVLENLIDNAVEAMSSSGMLTIRADYTDRHARIQIGDTGCGLDEQTLTRIFEPFYSTKGSGDERISGRGLGLAVAHGILKVLNGSVHVTSAIGEGTVFEIRLPLSGVGQPS